MLFYVFGENSQDLQSEQCMINGGFHSEVFVSFGDTCSILSQYNISLGPIKQELNGKLSDSSNVDYSWSWVVSIKISVRSLNKMDSKFRFFIRICAAR